MNFANGSYFLADPGILGVIAGAGFAGTLVLAGMTLGAVLTGRTGFLPLIGPATFDAVRH